MKSSEVRQRFLDYFVRNGHEFVASSSLVPANDPTLLFTNAGMVQFKDMFLGREKRAYNRATSSQRCVRAGGKHNDLENVGYTSRHHTFFEMLGNFSFGDYFKREAIEYAWELITKDYGLPEDSLWVTVFETDDEAADIWLKHIGVPKNRFTRLGEKENYWSMGDTGPCGPCTEIFFDHGPDVAGGPPGSADEDGDRFVEIWNLVFMQFDREAGGALTDLPKPSVDTGLGLERMTAVMQGVTSNYETDLFVGLIDTAMELAGAEHRNNPSLNVIADHVRACAFLIADGVLPSNEGRGYVLRRIIRRALRHGHTLGLREPFFYKLVEPLSANMAEAYPILPKQRQHVEKVLLREEERFDETLDQGMKLLEGTLADLSGKTIPGDVVFKLYDTYGFPVDLTADIARERGLNVDQKGYDAAMAEQRERAQAASQFKMGDGPKIEFDGATEFSGYETVVDQGKVVALLHGDGKVDTLNKGDEGVVVLDRTPFYAESGGQIGDTGVLVSDEAEFAVADTQKFGTAIGHIGRVTKGSIKLGDTIDARVDAERRAAIVLNHSATHLLHAALRKVLGEHVQQKGSLVAPDRLRFDFSHYGPVTSEELAEIERLVNEQIRNNVVADTDVMDYSDAIDSGALAFFGEKYDQRVRVLKLGDFSVELCGGTHVSRAGDIGFFKITSESGIAAGVRRLEAVTGTGALEYARQAEAIVQRLAEQLKARREDVADKVRQLAERNRELEKELDKLKANLAGSRTDELMDQAVDVDGIKVLAAQLDGTDLKTLRDTMDRLKDKMGSGVVVLGSVDGDKVRLVAGVTKDRTDRIRAGDIIRSVAEQVGGKGGGRPDMAQAGGTEPAKLPAALKSVPDLVRASLS